MNSSYPTRKVLLLEGVSTVARDAFEAKGYQVEYLTDTLSRDELMKKIADIHFIGIRSKTTLDHDVLEAATKLQAIGCFCIGTDRVDLKHAANLGIPVFNSPFCNSRSVAELVIHYIIGLARCLGDKNREMHNAFWKKTSKNCYEIRGKTLGIVGYGNVGSQLSVLAEAMGMHVQFYDIETKLAIGNANRFTDLNRMLGQCEFISIHVPATPETNMMFGKDQFEAMRDNSYLINASRGNVVDLNALANYLECGKLAGAALDVFPYEPISKNDYTINRLRNWANVILTPHIGGSTEEAQAAIGEQVSQRYINYVDFGNTVGAVNFPEMAPVYHRGTARICNIHQNQAGVLADINKLLSEYNIVQQTVKTTENIGYIICDLEKVENGIVFKEKLQKLQNSIRTRIRVH